MASPGPDRGRGRGGGRVGGGGRGGAGPGTSDSHSETDGETSRSDRQQFDRRNHMSHIEADPQLHVGPAVLLLLLPAPVQPRLALLLVRVPALERGLVVRDGLTVVESGELDLRPAPVSQPAVRAELHCFEATTLLW